MIPPKSTGSIADDPPNSAATQDGTDPFPAARFGGNAYAKLAGVFCLFFFRSVTGISSDWRSVGLAYVFLALCLVRSQVAVS